MTTVKGFRKGANLGGWLSQGPLVKEHLDTFITEKDIARIASWGLDHIRLPIDYDNFENEDGTDILEGYRHIDDCIAWCRKYNLNMVLDLHKTQGYIFDDFEYSKNFFDDERLQARFYGIWHKLMKKYAEYSDMLMVELLNEVVRDDVVDKWNDIASKCIDIIRSYSSDIKILVGGVSYNAISSVELLPDFDDRNIVYNFHCYEPQLFTHQSAYWVENMPLDFHIGYPADWDEVCRLTYDMNITPAILCIEESQKMDITSLTPAFFEKIFAPAVKTAKERGKCLYCGEYGVIDQAVPEDAVRWFKDIHFVFEKYGIGRSVWNYKGKDFGLADEHYDDVRDELIKYL